MPHRVGMGKLQTKGFSEIQIVDTHRYLETRFNIGLVICLVKINRTLLG